MTKIRFNLRHESYLPMRGEERVKSRKCVLLKIAAVMFLGLFLVTSCSQVPTPDTVMITKPHGASIESTERPNISVTADTNPTSEDTKPEETVTPVPIQSPMNPITPEDFRSIAGKLGYTISDNNFEGSGLEEMLSGIDDEYLYYIRYSLYATGDLAKAGIQDMYDNIKEGEEGSGFVGELSLTEKEGYDIIIAKSTDEESPMYAVYIRVNNAVLDAFCFSTQNTEMKVIDDFFTFFGYSINS